MQTNLNTKSVLNLWDYTDPTEYLRSYYALRKKHQSEFSYAQWAQELDIKSRSFLRLVLIGKRSLTEDVGKQFIRTLKFNQLEARYFTHLIRLSRASTLQEKEIHSRELIKIRQKFALKKHDIIEIQQSALYDFLSSYRIPRLQVLLTLNDVKKTESNLASLLQMKESEIKSHLQTLSRLGLAQKNENNEWRAIQAKVATQDILGNIALQSFHRKSLEEAVEAISLPPETRRYQSLVIPLSEEEFQTLHQDLRAQLEKSLEQFKPKQGENKRLYQLNLNIIPVTEPILRETSRAPVESTESLKEDHR